MAARMTPTLRLPPTRTALSTTSSRNSCWLGPLVSLLASGAAMAGQTRNRGRQAASGATTVARPCPSLTSVAMCSACRRRRGHRCRRLRLASALGFASTAGLVSQASWASGRPAAACPLPRPGARSRRASALAAWPSGSAADASRPWSGATMSARSHPGATWATGPWPGCERGCRRAATATWPRSRPAPAGTGAAARARSCSARAARSSAGRSRRATCSPSTRARGCCRPGSRPHERPAAANPRPAARKEPWLHGEDPGSPSEAGCLS
mmetsp:Transcript_33777/g.96600  ORF Transcript_33777/g.96600 Transcript_33777/m.96600 type:complete len:268 (+) Transcript_33777:1787-2590(+)